MIDASLPIQNGMNARLFPNNWRPAIEEVAFAAASGFDYIQFPGPEQGLDAERLGAAPEVVGSALRAVGVGAVMEMLVRIRPDGCTADGRTPVDALRANLPAIAALGIERVHWHPVRAVKFDAATARGVEAKLHAPLARALELATGHGLRFGFEHNIPGPGLFASLESCAAALEAIPGLGFVWDVNHTPLDQLDAHLALAGRMTLLHISDTPLPELNHHLPLGSGTIDLATIMGELVARGFRGPAILEIGGQPFSGGFGQDTDQALVDSRRRLIDAIEQTRGEGKRQ